MRFALAAALLVVPALATAQISVSEHDARAERIIQSLAPSFSMEGDAAASSSLEDLMAETGVPGVSIAFFDDGEVVWTRAVGMADVESGTMVTPETLFQAASISKPVAATAALDLVEDGLFDLDVPINDYLTSWQLSGSDVAEPSAVTLRGLLTHTAGLTVHGFPGYGPGETVPTTAGVLEGAGNTDAVALGQEPRTAFRYSGGGYTVAQLALENVTGRPFHEVMTERVLVPLGMEHSTFAQPLSESMRDIAATAYGGDGSAIDGRFHTYPEGAAAGLWTTPSDLARWAIALQANRDTHPVLEAATIDEMLTPDAVGGYGLGPSIQHEVGLFGHGGANAGFRCLLSAQLNGDQGVVVMTNGDNGGAITEAVLLTVAREYGWTGPARVVKAEAPMSRDLLLPFEGRYQEAHQAELTVGVRIEGERLVFLREWDGVEVVLAPEAPMAFFDVDDGTAIVFEDADGSAFGVQGLRFVRVE
ncbi:serine hydrolase domain-containing protein [Rubrivirga sp.]|uniref:serine hydrolase domain-containing protein n=1 Tax=Rubrivirga sp. TaxID=1885344 RepID=UPI003C753025